MNHRKTVVLGFLGTNLDRGEGAGRWEKWRPSVALCAAEEFTVGRFELLIDPAHRRLAEQVADDIRQLSPETEVRFHEIPLRDPWDFADVYEALHAFCASYRFDRSREDYLVHMTTGTHVAQICLFLLVEASFIPGRLVQTGPSKGRGARRDGGTGAAVVAGTRQVIDLDLSKYDRLATRFEVEAERARDFLRSGIATRNRAFNALIEEIEVVALRSRAPILLTGPTGAGKSQLARRIYELRQDRCGLDGAFVEVNCATLRGDTAASALFGHRKGAFTGAGADRPGLLREADGGMLFLDEIGELGADEQAMLLRALEEGTFLPVGADRPARSRFQLIAGTNRDLAAATAEGAFREDLLARINLWSFALPALAERREDIAPNLDYELRRFAEREGRAAGFNKEARAAFLRFAEAPDAAWRGNFRDLNAAVTRMATLAPRGRIRRDEVEAEVARLRASWQRPASGREVVGDLAALEEVLSAEAIAAIDPFDRVQLDYVLRVCKRSKTASEAGRELFEVSRAQRETKNDSDRVRKYLARFGLSFGAL